MQLSKGNIFLILLWQEKNIELKEVVTINVCVYMWHTDKYACICNMYIFICVTYIYPSLASFLSLSLPSLFLLRNKEISKQCYDAINSCEKVTINNYRLLKFCLKLIFKNIIDNFSLVYLKEKRIQEVDDSSIVYTILDIGPLLVVFHRIIES